MKIAVIVPAFKRPEYTDLCIKALEKAQEYKNTEFYLVDDGSRDGTSEILNKANLYSTTIISKENHGLRETILGFFDWVKEEGFDLIAKIDNDCEVPANWLNDAVKVFEETDVDILSPNVMPSDAAHKYGKDEGLPYFPSKIVGGLWIMRATLLNDVQFERMSARGIKGAFSLLYQIIVEKEPKVGWLPNVIVQDIGHWSGKHQSHIKSPEHEAYSAFVGRPVAWSAS